MKKNRRSKPLLSFRKSCTYFTILLLSLMIFRTLKSRVNLIIFDIFTSLGTLVSSLKSCWPSALGNRRPMGRIARTSIKNHPYKYLMAINFLLVIVFKFSSWIADTKLVKMSIRKKESTMVFRMVHPMVSSPFTKANLRGVTMQVKTRTSVIKRSQYDL